MPETCSDDHVVPRMGQRRGRQCTELRDRPMESNLSTTGVLEKKSLFSFKRAPASCAQLRTSARRLRSAHGPNAAPTPPAGAWGPQEGRVGFAARPGCSGLAQGRPPSPIEMEVQHALQAPTTHTAVVTCRPTTTTHPQVSLWVLSAVVFVTEMVAFYTPPPKPIRQRTTLIHPGHDPTSQPCCCRRHLSPH